MQKQLQRLQVFSQVDSSSCWLHMGWHATAAAPEHCHSVSFSWLTVKLNIAFLITSTGPLEMPGNIMPTTSADKKKMN